jgi:hypothetical protein
MATSPRLTVRWTARTLSLHRRREIAPALPLDERLREMAAFADADREAATRFHGRASGKPVTGRRRV